ncbi:MAG: exodeoxyribonuclease alpha subunit [Verrucomicrobiota bacterium]|jgi:exodeoxyribonuclease V alpha subunit
MSAAAPSPLDHPGFREIDRQFGAFIERLAGGGQPHLALASALASCRSGEGALFVDLRSPEAGVLRRGADSFALDLPERESWMTALRSSPVVGTPGEFKPLILDASGRLYLHRCWEQEQQLLASGPGRETYAVEPGKSQCLE